MFLFIATSEGPKKNEDLDQLARLNEKLLERSRGRRTPHKLVDPEIVKTAPDPVPATVKVRFSGFASFLSTRFSVAKV
ncbi:unnamed protein product [Gongylonema pulchrum]|uniref:Uncharacterized protein n=1 Tax=Gongylonema pulchrum TaxID=637853 RepID=A0A183E372_9BILA|nr:unnamed protein product [Gongylonema pulchrum]